jgi:hypothetical protein
MRISSKELRRCRISLRKAALCLSLLILASSVSIFFLALAIHYDLASSSTTQSWVLPRSAERTRDHSFLPLTAYIEPPLRPGVPLPLRENTILKEVSYPHVKSCLDIPNQFPVHHSKADDDRFGPNVGRLKSLYEVRSGYASICPVDADPFLPWIHDVFVSADYQFVEFVAHNKRRCRTDPSFLKDLENLEPQVALMQSVSIKRLSPDDEILGTLPHNKTQSRYRLAGLEEADEDARETRFLCHYHHVSQSGKRTYLAETLSVFPYNYEDVNFRKGPKLHAMLTKPANPQDTNGAHNDQVWNSILHFRCPVPSNVKQMIQRGLSLTKNNRVPGIYLDLVPIRTPPRETREGYSPYRQSPSFNPKVQWGEHHVLPKVEDSGRWANIPIGCRSPSAQIASKSLIKQEDSEVSSRSSKHYLVGCLWASASFTTRGPRSKLDDSTSQRLLEWLAYHLYIANLDHIYVYDNTAAHTNQTSLQPVIDLFPSDRVTRIPWKHRVCNNNFKGGERSSQYAAEASCRLRYGPTTEWLVPFDTDEYLIPHGNWTSLQDWLKKSVETGAISKDTHILSLYQTRPFQRVDFMEPYHDGTDDCGTTVDEAKCLAKREDTTFLETYDCETTPLPKPNFGWRAQKQIYRPKYVLNHFVHYSMVTKRVHDAPGERIPAFRQQAPYERRVNELTEAFMLHTKTKLPHETRGWQKLCSTINKEKVSCPVGIPWPADVVSKKEPTLNNDGLAYNCYQHGIIQNDLAIRLHKILKPLLARFKRGSL